MHEDPRRRGLLALAVEGVVPVLGGCAGALAGGPEAGVVGGLAGIAVGQVVEKVINVFGLRIVARWAGWLRSQAPAVQQQALNELASMSPEEVRAQARALLDELPLELVSPEDRAVAVDYLSLLPGALDRALPRDLATGARALPATVSFDEPQALLALLPVNLPPYPVGVEVPGTVYRLEALLGSGGFGAVYRASARGLQHLPLAIKFCLDPGLSASLHRERGNLERLMKAGRENWSPRVVRLYGYDLEHPTPFLVYEYVTGGDLTRHVAERQAALARPLNHEEVHDLIVQAAEALAFAHTHGLVHRDLKPANILVEGGVLKLADFGLGGVTAARSAVVSRIGATTVDQLSVADQASLFRGAGTPLYMAPEQRRGQPPDPRHDLYSLGVMWYQLLVGDVSRELHPGWAKELTLRHGVPRRHLDLIELCVGWYDERPAHAGELLALMRQPAAPPSPPPAPTERPGLTPAPQPAKAPEIMQPAVPITVPFPAEAQREELLATLVKQLEKAHEEYVEKSKNFWSFLWVPGAAVLFIFPLVMETVTRGALGFFLAMMMVGAIGAVAYIIRLGLWSEARDKVLRFAQLLQGEFPEIVRAWGGETALRNREVFLEVTASYRRPDAPTATLPTLRRRDLPRLAPEQRDQAADLLRRLEDSNRAAEKLTRRRPLPVAVALLIALILGGLAALGMGTYVWTLRAPVTITYYRSGTYVSENYQASGRTIDDGQLTLAYRWLRVWAGAAGAACGTVVFFAVLVSLSARPWMRWPLFAGGVLGLAVGGALGLGAGFAYDSLFAPYYLVTYQGGAPVVTYYNANAAPIDEPTYRVAHQRALANAGLLGVGVGTLVLLAVTVLVQRLAYRRAEWARNQLPELLDQAQARLPDLVAAAGGPDALRRRDRVEELLEALKA